MRLLQTNEELLRLKLLATVSWTPWLPAFQLPMFAKCDALPKGDVLDMFVEGIHAFCKI